MIGELSALHWLRPDWLWALLALPPLAAAWLVRRRRGSVWRSAVDPHLLPHLLEGGASSRRAGPWWAAVAYLLAVVALAGPSWRQVEQPLWQNRTPLVVAMDLSSAALAADLPPSRLAQAQAKVSALLELRRDGQVGLVAYAGDAFTVAPLTDDAANVALFVPSLHPQVMPVDGQRADLAIAWSARLLQRAGFDRGQILLLTGAADAAAREAAAAAASQGYTVSVLGVGGSAAAPYRQSDGSLATASLDASSLRAVANSGGGRYATLTTDARDLASLDVLDSVAVGAGDAASERGRSWQDQGFWLIPPLMLLSLLAFRRRGGALAVLLVLGILPWHPAMASAAQDGGGLWQRPDQALHERLQTGTEAYRRGEFDRAAEQYRQVESADGQYNLGNALARQGRYEQAIKAYDRALQLQPGMADALANRRAVQAAMQRKPPPGQKPQQNQNDTGQQGEGQSQEPAQDGQDGQGNGDQRGQPPEAAGSESPPDGAGQPPSPSPPDAADAAEQAQADAAQRERMQRALEQAEGSGEPGAEAAPTQAPPETREQRERRLANEAWLRRIPDDPGGLLREKFRLEYERRQREGGWEP